MQLLNKSIKILIVFLVGIMIAQQAIGEAIQIKFTHFDTFSTEIAHIEAGDVVKWMPTSEGHNVGFLAGPDMDNLPPSSVMDVSHTVRFDHFIHRCTQVCSRVSIDFFDVCC